MAKPESKSTMYILDPYKPVHILRDSLTLKFRYHECFSTKEALKNKQ